MFIYKYYIYRFISCSYEFISRNSAFISHNSEFISYNSAFISCNFPFICHNSAFMSHNSEFISRNSAFISHKKNVVCFAGVRKTSWKLLFLVFTVRKVRCTRMWSCRGFPHPQCRVHPAHPSTSTSPPLHPQKAPASSPLCRRTPAPLHSVCGHRNTLLFRTFTTVAMATDYGPFMRTAPGVQKTKRNDGLKLEPPRSPHTARSRCWTRCGSKCSYI